MLNYLFPLFHSQVLPKNNIEKLLFILVNDWINYDEYDFEDETTYDHEFPWPYLQKESVNDILPKQRINKKGVVDECCRKPCSYDNLLMYCGK